VIVAAKTPTNNSSTTRGLKNPRIIEKKYIGNQSASGQNSTQQSHRYVSKDGAEVAPVRKSSHTGSIGSSNVFTRLRSGTSAGVSNSNSTTRYSGHGA